MAAMRDARLLADVQRAGTDIDPLAGDRAAVVGCRAVDVTRRWSRRRESSRRRADELNHWQSDSLPAMPARREGEELLRCQTRRLHDARGAHAVGDEEAAEFSAC